ncbi:hypothetical protein TIFTF001_043695, partial [Ficus carica]
SSGRHVHGNASSSRDVVGVLGNIQLPEKRALVPRVAGVLCDVPRGTHTGREDKAALRILKFRTLSSIGSWREVQSPPRQPRPDFTLNSRL